MAHRENSKMGKAYNIFVENVGRLEELGEKEFRKTVIGMIQKLGVKPNSAATMYQIAKKEAVANGVVKDFGRTANGTAGGRKPKIRIPEGTKWMRVNKETGKPVAYYTSRNAARADKLEGTKVVKYEG